jgi:hypothetical protein
MEQLTRVLKNLLIETNVVAQKPKTLYYLNRFWLIKQILIEKTILKLILPPHIRNNSFVTAMKNIKLLTI